MKRVQVIQGADHNRDRSRHHRKRPPRRLGPAQAKDPQAEREKDQAHAHGNDKECNPICCGKRRECHIDGTDFPFCRAQFDRDRLANLKRDEGLVQIAPPRNGPAIDRNELIADLESLFI